MANPVPPPPNYRLQRSGFITRVSFGPAVPPLTQTMVSTGPVTGSIVFVDTTAGGFRVVFPPTARGDSVIVRHVAGTLPAELAPDVSTDGVGAAGSTMTIYPGQGLVFAADTANHVWWQVGTV